MPLFQPTKSDRFAFGLRAVMATAQDAENRRAGTTPTGLDAITELGSRGVFGYALAVEDLVPPGADAAQRDALIREAQKRMGDADIVCVSCDADIAAHPMFKDGALTNHSPEIRQLALQRYLTAIDVGYELGCSLSTLCWVRDGAEADAAKSPLDAIRWLRESLNYLQHYIEEQGYAGYRLGVVPKPNEPRGDIYIPTGGHALALIATIEKPESCGVIVDLGHARMAGLNAYHETAQAMECGRLFGCWLNAQRASRFEQDLRFGAEDLKEAFFVVKLLENAAWSGSRCFNADACRTAGRGEVWDFVDGCMRSYLILKEKVHRFNADAEIQGLLNELRRVGDEPLPPSAWLRERVFDTTVLAQRRLQHEKLDQLTQELLLGVR